MAEALIGENPCAQLLDGTLPPVELPIVTGWRRFYPSSYSINRMLMLEGQFGIRWETRELCVCCRCAGSSLSFDEHVKDPTAQCGIYIYKEPPIVEAFSIYVAVTGWGLGYEHESGWRMQFCRIERFIVGSDFVHPMPWPWLQRYGVPIDRAPTSKWPAHWPIEKETHVLP